MAGCCGISPFFCEQMEKGLSPRVIILLLVFVVLGVYYPAIFAPLNSVDDPGMYLFLLNEDHFSFRSIFVPGGSGAYYRPLLLTSFLVDKYLWGLEESFMHLGNILIHLCNTLLLYAVARRVSRRLEVVSHYPALLASLFFALHPLNTESVVWISGRTDLLAGMFILLSVFFLFAESCNVLSSILAAFSLLLACLSKDTAIFFLPAAILFPFFQGKDRATPKEPPFRLLRENMVHFLVFVAAGVGYFTFRALAFSRGDLGAKQVMTHVVGDQGADLLLSARLVLKAAGFYVKKLFIPFPLNFGIVHVSDLYIIVGLLLLVAVVWWLVRSTLPVFFFIGATAIGSSALLVPLLKMTWTPLAERYMYVPSAFFLMGMVFTAHNWTVWLHYRKFTVLVVSCLAAVAIYSTAQRTILWQDNLAFFQDCRRKSPDFIPAQNEIANALYQRGKIQEAAEIVKSIVPPEDLVNIQYVQISKAAALANDGDVVAAHDLLVKVLKNPGKHEVEIITRILKLNDYRIMQEKAERGQYYTENVRLLTRLYEVTGDPFHLYRLGQAHMFEGERVKARDAFQRVVNQASPQAYYYSAAQRLQERLSN